MEIYTMKDWERDGDLNPRACQIVADDVIEEIIRHCPTRICSATAIQIDEPYGFNETIGLPTYQTFLASNEGWRYIGECIA